MKRLIFLVLLPLTGCVWNIDEEHSALSDPGTVVEDCVVPRPASVADWGAPVSIEYPDRSLWLWGELTVADGTTRRNVGAFVPSVAAACGGEMEMLAGTDDLPRSLLTLTAEEEADNAARTDGRRVQLSFIGGFVHDKQAWAFYEKILAGPGFFDTLSLGTGLCRMVMPDMVCERLEPGTVPDEPTLLWGQERRPLNRGVSLGPDGMVYWWGCLHAAALTDPCSLARVSPDDAADPAAYEYAGFDGTWGDDSWNSAALFDNAGWVTPGFIPYLDRWVAVTTNIWDSAVELREAKDPQGAYGAPVRLFDAVPPADWFIGGGAMHAALAAEEGRVIAVSYSTTAAGPQRGLHLVTFRFE